MLFKKNKKKKPKHIPKNVRESIPYVHVYENGVIETTPGVFTRAYTIEDVNFAIAPDEDQTAIFLEYGKILNSFDKGARFQVVIQNHATDKRKTLAGLRILPQRDELNSFRNELNNNIIEKTTEGRNSLTQDKYLVVAIEDDNVDSAMGRFEKMDLQVDKMFRRITKDKHTAPQTLQERLKVLHSIYNVGAEEQFYNAKSPDGEPVFDMDKELKVGKTTKDMIAPSGIEIRSNRLVLGDKYACTLYMDSVPQWMTTEYLADIADVSCNLLISVTYEPVEPAVAIKTIKDMMLNIDGDISSQQKTATKGGYSADLINTDLFRQQKHIRALMDDVLTRDQKIYFVTVAVTVFGDTEAELDQNVANVQSAAETHMAYLRPLSFLQEEGFNTTLPLALNRLCVSKMLTTESASVFIPYTTQEVHQKNGILYGINKTSKHVIVYNRLLGRNYNGLIFGEPGSGKSFQAKYEMVTALLSDPKNVVYVIDPQSEYSPLAKKLGGEIADLAPGSTTFINPLDMDIGYGDGGDPLALKTDYNISLLEIMMGKGRVINPEGRSIVSRCTQNIYQGYLRHLEEERRAGKNITIDHDAAPTLANLYQDILLQPEPAAKDLASVLEVYARGSLATFAHRSNVDTDSRFLVYDIRKLGPGTKELALHVCLNDILNKMYANYAKGLNTWFYIDEFHILLQSDSAARFLAQIWKTARKWNGIPTGIMQNTEDLLRSVDSRAVLNNTSFITMMSLQKIDRMNLAELLSVSESQMDYITNADPGHGLIYTGKTVLPFENEFSEKYELYKLMNTRIRNDDDPYKRLQYIG